MRKLAASCLALVLLTGCAVGPDYKQPPVTAPDAYRDVQGPPAPAASIADQPWWDIFGDPVLKQLIDQSLQTGYDVQIAAARVEESRARAGIARSEFFPQINYGAQSSRGRNSIYLPPNSTATNNLNLINVNFGWELDIWGRIRRLNEAAKAQYLATEDARRGVLLSLVSDVATTYFSLRELDEELTISKKTVAAFQETYDLYKRKLDQGAASALEAAYAEAALGQVAAQVPEIERRIEQTENQLNLLLGKNPAPIPRGEALAAQPLPPEVPAGLPSELLQRRPDVRQSEQQLISANALVGVATANFFPQISLTGIFGTVGPQLDSFFYPAGKTWSIAAGLLGPLFQGEDSAANTTPPTPSGNRRGSSTSRPSRVPSPRRRPSSTLARRSRPRSPSSHARSPRTRKWCACRTFATTPALRTTSRFSTRCSSCFPPRSRSRARASTS